MRYAGTGVLVAVLASTQAATAAGMLSTPSGQAVRVSQHGSWSQSSCEATGLPLLSIEKQPKHGSLQTRPETITLGSESNSCAGHQIQGLVMYYVPATRFHGADAFTYRSSFGASGHSKTYDYTVGVY